MSDMRAKLQVTYVQELFFTDKEKQTSEKFGEQLMFCAVSRNDAYPEDGSDENNTYAKYSPSANFTLDCRNPALWGKFKTGDQFYVDFTKVQK